MTYSPETQFSSLESDARDTEAAQALKDVKQELEQLRGRTNLLTGLLVVAVLALVGANGLLTYRLQGQQKRFLQDTSTTAETLKRVEILEKQLQSVSKRVPDNLKQSLEENQKRLQDLSEEISQLAASTNALQTLDEALEKIQDQPIPDETSTPSDDSTASPESTTSPEDESTNNTQDSENSTETPAPTN